MRMSALQSFRDCGGSVTGRAARRVVMGSGKQGAEDCPNKAPTRLNAPGRERIGG